MIKLILVGVIGAAAAAGGAVFALINSASPAEETQANEQTQRIENISTELAAVPVINAGKVTGYLVLKVTSKVDMATLKNSDEVLLPYLNDATFRATFDLAGEGVTEFKSKHVEELEQSIAQIANDRIGAKAVLSVHLEQFNLVSASEIREKFVQSQ